MATAATDTPSEARRFTGDEVMRMVEAGILGEDEKAELLDGTLSVMTPQGFDHGDVITRLTMTLARTCPQGLFVRPQVPIGRRRVWPARAGLRSAVASGA